MKNWTDSLFSGIWGKTKEGTKQLSFGHVPENRISSVTPSPQTSSPVLKGFEKQEYDTVVGAIPETLTKNSTHVIFGDGMYLVRKNSIGKFIRRISSQRYPGVDDGPVPSFEFYLPKIPIDILKAQVSFYRDVMRKHNNAEAYTMIMWDQEENKYLLVCPNQKVSAGSLVYDFGDDLPSSRYLQVVSCHSHNSMSAFFSSIDDADEKGDMCYMVLGHLDKDVPQYKIRASVAGAQVKLLDLEDLFDDSVSDESLKEQAPAWRGLDYPEEWMSRIQSGVSRHTANDIMTFGEGRRDPRFPSSTAGGKEDRFYSFEGGYWSRSWDDSDWAMWSDFEKEKTPSRSSSRAYGISSGFSEKELKSLAPDQRQMIGIAQSLIRDLRDGDSIEEALFEFAARVDVMGYGYELQEAIDLSIELSEDFEDTEIENERTPLNEDSPPLDIVGDGPEVFDAVQQRLALDNLKKD